MINYNGNKQDSKRIRSGIFQSLSSQIASQIGIVLRKKGGFDVDLLEKWPQIVGEEIGKSCLPFKIKRSRASATGEDFQAKSVTLFVACEGFSCLKIQHQADEIIEKINLFLGSQVIDKIKIVQKSLHFSHPYRAPTRPLSQAERQFLEEQTDFIDDAALRASVIRLGQNIMATTSCLKKSNI